MTHSLIPRKVRRYDGGRAMDAASVEVAQAGLGIEASGQTEEWVTALRTQGAAAHELAQHAVDRIDGESDGLTWADATADDLAAGYSLSYLTTGRDPAVHPLITTDGSFEVTGAWDIYVTVPRGVPPDRVRVEYRDVTGSAVRGVLPPDGGTQWGLSSHESHDSLEGYRLNDSDGDRETIIVSADQEIALQILPAGRSDAFGLDAHRFDADPNAGDYVEGDIVVVGERRRILVVTAGPDHFPQAQFVSDEVGTADGTEHWHGVSLPGLSIAPPGVGSFLANPNTAVAYIGFEDNGLSTTPLANEFTLQAAFAEDVLLTAVSGSDENDLPASVLLLLAWADDSDSWTLSRSLVSFHHDSRRYHVYSTRFTPATSNRFGARTLPDVATIEVLDNVDDQNYLLGTQELTRHWIDYEDEFEKANRARARLNSGRLDRVEGQVETLLEQPLAPTVVPTGNLIEVDRLPNPNAATPARAIVTLLPDDTHADRTRLLLVSRAGGAQWNDWSFSVSYDSSAADSLEAAPSGAVAVVGNQASGTRYFQVDGAGAADLTVGLLCTVGTDSTQHRITDVDRDTQAGTTHIAVRPHLAAQAADTAAVNFVGVPIAISLDAPQKQLRIGLNVTTAPIQSLATYIESATGFPAADWYIDHAEYADYAIGIRADFTAVSAMSVGGLDAPTTGEYVRLEVASRENFDGGGHINRLPGLYQLADYPADLSGPRMRVKLGLKNGYHGFWSASRFGSGGLPFDVGQVLFDSAGAGIAGLYVHTEGGASDYNLYVNDGMFLAALVDRVRFVWANEGDPRRRLDENADGVEPHVANPHNFNPGDFSLSSIIANFYGSDGSTVVTGVAFSPSPGLITLGDVRYHHFEALGSGSDILRQFDVLDYVDINLTLDVDHAFQVIRDWMNPVALDNLGSADLRATGTPGVSERRKAWVPIDVWHPTTAQLAMTLESRLGGISFRELANQAAYDAITPDSHTMYIIRGNDLGSRRIYFGANRFD